MSKKKRNSINTGGGAYIGKGVNIDKDGTFVGRDKINGTSSKPKLEHIVRIIVAIIGTVGLIIVAILNGSNEIDKIKLQGQMTQTAEALLMSPKLTASSTLAPTGSNLTTTPSP